MSIKGYDVMDRYNKKKYKKISSLKIKFILSVKDEFQEKIRMRNIKKNYKRI